jgi:hypothetical protein
MSGQLTRPASVGEAPQRGTRAGWLRSSGPVPDAVVVLGVFVVLGILCGLLWWLLVDPAMFTKFKTGAGMGELELSKQFDSDGWYAVIAAVTGVVAGSLLTWWRSRDFLLTTVLMVVGSAIAAAVMAETGHLLGPPDPRPILAAAAVGTRVPVQLSVTAKASYLVWPIAALVGALLVLWSSPRDAGVDPSWPAPEPHGYAGTGTPGTPDTNR